MNYRITYIHDDRYLAPLTTLHAPRPCWEDLGPQARAEQVVAAAAIRTYLYSHLFHYISDTELKRYIVSDGIYAFDLHHVYGIESRGLLAAKVLQKINPVINSLNGLKPDWDMTSRKDTSGLPPGLRRKVLKDIRGR